jgi:hypothetical protein
MKKIATLLLCLYSFLFMAAQQNLGIRSSNYAGIQASLLNPSAIADSKLKWDVYVLSLGVVFDNNFLYIPKGTIPVLGFKSIIEGIKHEDKFYTHFDPGDPDKRYNFILSNEILGPSFHMQIAKTQEIGFTLVSRSYVNINDFSGHLAESAFDYLQNRGLWNTAFHDNTTRFDGMNWLEYGLHYAKVLYKEGNRELTGGISLKYLQGIAAAYVKNTNLTYTVVDTSQLIFTHSNLDYGRTDYNSYRKIKNYQDLNHGHGFGGDIGFTYELLRETTTDAPRSKKWYEPDKSNYVYKLGLSLIDIGSINFNRMASAYHLQADSANFLDWHKANFTNNIQVDQTLSSVFYQGDSTKSLKADHFRMGLSAAISLQADWNFYKGFFANATIIKGFGHSNGQGVVRPDVYSLTPRYETKWFEASIPISLMYYGNWRPRVGFAVRAGYFFFGGDALGGLLGLRDLQGVDFYAGVHFFVAR